MEIFSSCLSMEEEANECSLAIMALGTTVSFSPLTNSIGSFKSPAGGCSVGGYRERDQENVKVLHTYKPVATPAIHHKAPQSRQCWYLQGNHICGSQACAIGWDSTRGRGQDSIAHHRDS